MNFTPRQNEIIQLKALGFTNLRVAEVIGTTQGNVETILRYTMKRVRASNYAQLTYLWATTGPELQQRRQVTCPNCKHRFVTKGGPQ